MEKVYVLKDEDLEEIWTVIDKLNPIQAMLVDLKASGYKYKKSETQDIAYECGLEIRNVIRELKKKF